MGFFGGFEGFLRVFILGFFGGFVGFFGGFEGCLGGLGLFWGLGVS